MRLNSLQLNDEVFEVALSAHRGRLVVEPRSQSTTIDSLLVFNAEHLSHGSLLQRRDGENEPAELTGTAKSVVAEHSYYGMAVPHALIASRATYYSQQDLLGNVVAVTTTSGTTARTYQYADWGTAAGTGGTIVPPGDRVRWKGALSFAEETELYYLRARWYDPGTGRFLSEDPIGLGGGINPSVFAGDEPVNGRDPDGMCYGGDRPLKQWDNPGGGRSEICISESGTLYAIFTWPIQTTGQKDQEVVVLFGGLSQVTSWPNGGIGFVPPPQSNWAFALHSGAVGVNFDSRGLPVAGFLGDLEVKRPRAPNLFLTKLWYIPQTREIGGEGYLWRLVPLSFHGYVGGLIPVNVAGIRSAYVVDTR